MADDVERTFTAFEDELSSVLGIELEMKLLALQNVDIKYSNKNIITSMEPHTQMLAVIIQVP